jgi:hypothetical protein
VLADRALISVFPPREKVLAEPEEPVRVSRRPSRASKTPPEATLTAEVERILGSSPFSTERN